MADKRKRVPKRHKDYTFKRNGTTVEVRVVSAEKTAYYVVLDQGPVFLEDMATLREVWTTLGWQFVPWAAVAK